MLNRQKQHSPTEKRRGLISLESAEWGHREFLQREFMHLEYLTHKNTCASRGAVNILSVVTQQVPPHPHFYSCFIFVGPGLLTNVVVTQACLNFLNILNYPAVFQRARAANILERTLAWIQPYLKHIHRRLV